MRPHSSHHYVFHFVTKWCQALLRTEIIAPFINFTFAETSQPERKFSLMNSVIAVNAGLEGLVYCLYIYDLSNDAACSPDYVASDGRAVGEWGSRGEQSWPI
jgi:hypothetical protein